MKKLLSVLLCATLIFALVGCGKDAKKEQSSKKDGASSLDANTNSATNSDTGSETGSSDATNSNTSSETGDETVFKLTAAKGVAKFDDYNKVVICWGDSITQGMAMGTGYTYPQQLQDSIGSAFRVINAGVPGETSEAILSRANAVEICLTNDVKFAKGEKQVALDRNLFKMVGADAPLTYKGFGNQLKLNTVIIDGQKYTIEYEKGESYDVGTYRLTRTDTSKELTLPAGTKVKYDYTEQYTKNHCNVIYIGGNDGKLVADVIINKYKKLTSLNENYIVIIPHYSENDLSKEFKEAFGNKAIDIREYMVNQAHIDYNVELTEMDNYCIKKNIVPASYSYKNQKGDAHLNELGYKILADQVYKKGVELGYWK